MTATLALTFLLLAALARRAVLAIDDRGSAIRGAAGPLRGGMGVGVASHVSIPLATEVNR